MKKRISLALAALMLLTALLSGAAFATEQSAPLTVWWSADNPDFSQHIQNFKTIYPNAEITMYPSEDMKTQLRLAVNSGTAPDVFHINSGTMFLDFYNAGALMDLTDIIAENGFMDRINPYYIKPYSIDGRNYAYPAAALTTWQDLYVNRDLLASAGITEDPATVTEMLDVATKLNEAGIAPVAFGDKDGWPAIILLGDYFAQQVEDLSLINQLNAGEITFPECEPFVKALETIVTYGQNNVFMGGWTSSDHTAAIQTFAAGQTAYLYNGSWWSAIVQGVDDLGFELDVIWLPLIDGLTTASSVQMSSDMAFAANANSTNIEGITMFLDYMSSEETTILNAETSNSFSVYPGSNEKINRADVFNQPPVLDQFTKPALAPFFDWVFPTPVTEALKVKIVECIDGTTTIEAALADLQAVMDENLNSMPVYGE